MENTNVGSAGTGVGIFEAERRENFRLQPLHLDGLRLRFVVIANQVQKTVQDKMLHMVGRLKAALRGLLGNRLGRQHDITQVAIGLPVRAARGSEGKERTLVGISLPR